MTKIDIKKIDNRAARHVTFTKRRGGLFKKAEQLSVLCDVEVAGIIFSAAGRPYVYSSSNSSLNDILTRYESCVKKPINEDELELLNGTYAILCEEAMKKGNELRQLKGEGLQGLDMEELQNLEDMIEISLQRVREGKEKCFTDEITTIQQQLVQLEDENDKLKQMMITGWENPLQVESGNAMQQEEWCASEPLANNDPLAEDASSVTLKLGLPSS